MYFPGDKKLKKHKKLQLQPTRISIRKKYTLNDQAIGNWLTTEIIPTVVLS